MDQLIEAINKLALPVKIGAVAGFAILITAASYFLLVQPVEEQSQSISDQQTSMDRTLAEKQAIADNLNEKRREMDALDQKLQEALTQLPEKKELEELLAQLNDVGKKSGLDIAKVTPSVEAPRSFYAEIPIQVSVSGNFHEIALFLQEIANLRRIVNVSDLKLTQPSMRGSSDKVILNSEFIATTYRFIESRKGAKN
jgi:type IV pilus assembly protein PilO